MTVRACRKVVIFLQMEVNIYAKKYTMHEWGFLSIRSDSMKQHYL